MIRKSFSVLTAALVVVASAGSLAAQGTGDPLLPEPDQSNTRVGTRGANFLEIPVGARAIAMGNAVTSVSQGASSLYWNPAGIAVDPRFSAAFSYNDMYGDFGLTHFFGGLTLPVGTGAFGFHFISFSSGEIERTTAAFPEGGDPQFGATFEWSDIAMGLSYGQQITDRLAVGLTVKYVQSGIDDAKASFIGGDAGVRFRTGLLGTTLGASLLNLGSDGKYSGTLLNRILTSGSEVFPTDRTLPVELDTRGWDMPTVFTFSVMWDMVGSPDAILTPSTDHSLIAVTEATDAIDGPLHPNLGLEYSYRQLFFVRGGKYWPAEENTGDFRDFSYGLSGGFGVAVPVGEGKQLILDYAYSDRGLLENIQVFSVEFNSR